MNITGGKYNSLTVKTADFANIKPTLSKIRQAVFNSLAAQGEYKTFCDLFAGSGIMTFEAISRDYETISVEIDKKSANFIKNNAEKLKIPVNLINYDAVKFLQKTDKTFDIFYLDPPYKSNLYNKVLFEIADRNLLNKGGVIVLEKPCSVEIDLNGFECFKEKKYSDKVIMFLKNKKPEN